MPAALRRGLSFFVPVALAIAGLGQAPAFAAPPKRISKPAAVPSVPGSYARPSSTSADATAAQNTPAGAAVRWPAASVTDVRLPADADLSVSADHDATAAVTLPGVPVRLARTAVSGKAIVGARVPAVSPDRVRVQVLDSAASTGNRSVLLRLTRTDSSATAAGKVRVSLDYSGFRDAYGGDWSSRLRLVQLPECALTDPAAPACRPHALTTANDTVSGAVTATVALDAEPVATPQSRSTNAAQSVGAAGALVALASAPQSTDGGGDFAATPVSATSSWSAGGQGGDFTWSYPIRTPASPGGPAPDLGIGYSSQGLDGLTAATNNQPSWVGDGFDYNPGVIRRSYVACSDDGKTGVGDQCWGTDNATLSLPGRASGELIQVSTNPDVWKVKNDDGTRVERLPGAVNGARNGEFWRVTTPDGWQYSFGLNRLPGWSANKPTTDSVYTMPVFGNNGGTTPEPCYAATFANAWCDQAYAWNLDYVVDPRGNSMSFWYSRQLNHYARNATAGTVSTYVRGGHVTRIDYGTRLDGGVDSFYSTGVAPARVELGLTDRCVTAGSTCVQSTPSNWPDVPWDQQCDSATSCPNQFSPTFFTQKKLSTVTTKIWTGTGTTYRDVERTTFSQVFKDPGDGRAKTLWLNSIVHTGLDGTAIDVPAVTFKAVQLSNRVDTSPTKNPIIRFRVSSIVTEFGGEIAVTYSQPECVTGVTMPGAADTNVKRCYPVYWTPYGTSTATFDWFHKYVVTGVTVTDKTGLAPAAVWNYQYIGNPGWHYDDAELVPPAHKTWGQWRGYPKIRVVTGAADTARLQTDTVYFQGMHGDKTGSGTRTVQVAADPDFGGSAVNDEDWRAGQVRETITFNGVGDSAPVVSKVLTEPWQSGPTVTRTRNGVKADAYLTGTRSTTTRTWRDGSRPFLTTKTTNTFDTETGLPSPIGRIVKVEEANDVSRSDDDRCRTKTYATDPAGRIRTAVAQERVVLVSCSAQPNLATDLLSDDRTWFDLATSFDAVVRKGDVTRTERLGAVTGGTVSYVTGTVSTYDDYGRTRTTTDALGYQTSKTYTPAAGALATSVAVTNAKGWTKTAYVNPAYGHATATVDENNRRVDATYDALGRLVAVWEPGRDKLTQTATRTYTYTVGGISAITSTATAVLNPAGNGYLTSYELFDGLARPRQTQHPAVGGGVVLTDTLYDSRGLAVQSNGAYFQAGVSWGTLFVPSSPVPGRTITTYDNAGRATDAIFQVNGVERWRTHTYDGGDHTDTTTPAGGTATAVYVNALGQITERRHFQGNTPTGTPLVTRYGYTKAGKVETVTDPAGTVWSYVFDVRGRNVETVDPDRGRTKYTYDDLDRQLTVEDSRGVLRTNVYDELSRISDMYQGTAATGTLLAHNTFDTIRKGQTSVSTRYVGANAYSSKNLEFDAANRPTKTAVTIPAGEGVLAGEYVTSATYDWTGHVATMTLPAVGGTGSGSLPAETLTFGYNAMGLPTTLSGANTYVTDTAYDQFGRISATLFNNGGAKNLAQLWSYEAGTNRVLEHGVYDNDSGEVYQDAYPTYDDAGRITAVKDLLNQYGAGPDDNQCFRYDGRQHLTNAWTPSNGNCTTDPATVAWSALGGPSPYWQSWTYDAAGNRATQKDRTAAGDTTSTSAYPAATATKPHAVTQVTVAGPGGTTTNTYGYDLAGNTGTRALAGRPSQTLTWDAEGRLASVTDSAGAASYVYDVSGKRIMTKDSTGTTLYLGGQEVRVSKTNQISSTRFYGSSALRSTTGGLCWLVSDAHGTGDLTFVAATLAKTQRRRAPFGSVRGSNPSWVSTRGFVGGIDEPTGLVQIGARPYDAALGRFIAVDPVFAAEEPQSFNGYGYANYNPINASDASGMRTDDQFYQSSNMHDGVGSTAGPAPTPRQVLLDKITNPKLKKTIGALYREGASVGDGSTAAAIEQELITGEPHVDDHGYKIWHYTKGVDSANELANLLQENEQAKNNPKKQPVLTPEEEQIARAELRRLWTVLNYDDPTGKLREHWANNQGDAEHVKRGLEKLRSNAYVADITGADIDVKVYGGVERTRTTKPGGGAALKGAAGFLIVLDIISFAILVQRYGLKDGITEYAKQYLIVDIWEATGQEKPVCMDQNHPQYAMQCSF